MDIRVIWGDRIPYDGALTQAGEATLRGKRHFSLDEICKKVFVDIDMHAIPSPKIGGILCTVQFDRGKIEDVTELMRDTIEWYEIELRWRAEKSIVKGTVTVVCTNGIETTEELKFETQNIIRLVDHYKEVLGEFFKNDPASYKAILDIVDVWNKRIAG